MFFTTLIENMHVLLQKRPFHVEETTIDTEVHLSLLTSNV